MTGQIEVVNIVQTIEELGDSSYRVTLDISGEVTSEDFYKTNQVFPVYRSLIEALTDIEDAEVEVITNSDRLATEYNEIENRNATLLKQLKNIVSRNGIILTILLGE